MFPLKYIMLKIHLNPNYNNNHICSPIIWIETQKEYYERGLGFKPVRQTISPVHI